MDQQHWSLKALQLVDRLYAEYPFYRLQVGVLADALQQCNRVLDLCAGLGNLTKLLLERGKRVTALDVNPNSLKHIAQKVSGQYIERGLLQLIEKDAAKMRFSSEFDGVGMLSDFEVFTEPDLVRVVDGAFRALMPGGVFAATGLHYARMQEHEAHLMAETHELKQAGKLQLTPQEMAFLDRVHQEHPNTIVSSEQVTGLLASKGFEGIRVAPYYYDTCYLISARKPTV